MCWCVCRYKRAIEGERGAQESCLWKARVGSELFSPVKSLFSPHESITNLKKMNKEDEEKQGSEREGRGKA